MTSKQWTTALLLGLAASAGCEGDGPAREDEPAYAMTTDAPTIAEIDAAEWEALASRRIFFGHQSVGRDIMLGVQRVLKEHPEIGLRVVTSDDPSQVEGPAFIEARIGKNREPETKANAFEAIVENGLADGSGAVAMLNYCYVDILPETDPDALFEDYARRIESLRQRHPELLFVHITLPLHTAPEGLMERIRTRLGRNTQTALNIKRNRYNDLLRERYEGVDPLFDLAKIQSTRADGTRAYTRYRGQNVYMLAPEWTYDGGHLNEEAQVRIAERFLAFLARLPRTSGTGARLADASSPAR